MLKFLKEHMYFYISLFILNCLILFAIEYYFECDKTEILTTKSENIKIAENIKIPLERVSEKRPLSFAISEPRPDTPPPPTIEDKKKPRMIIDGQELFMIEDLKGRLRWIPKGQEQNFKRHELAKINFSSKDFDSKEYNYEWTTKMQESVFQEIQSNDKFTNILIDNVACRADVGCRIDATALTSDAKYLLPRLAAELGNIGKPRDSFFYRTYSMDNVDKSLGIMRIYISGSIYD